MPAELWSSRSAAAYFQGVLAQTNLEVAEAILQEIDRVIELNRTRLEKGDISGVELKRVEVERLKFIDDVFATRLALVNAKSTLLTLLGLPPANASFKFSGVLMVDSKPAHSSDGIPPPAALPGAGTPGLCQTARPDGFHVRTTNGRHRDCCTSGLCARPTSR